MDFITETININDKDYVVLIGKNAQGNEQIIKSSHPESLWFHFDNISSPHIILQSNGDIIPKRYINKVASMLFNYKKAVPQNINVIYTQVKNVKRTDIIGTVIPKHTNLIKF